MAEELASMCEAPVSPQKQERTRVNLRFSPQDQESTRVGLRF